MNKFEQSVKKVINEARVKKTELTKRVAKKIEREYWNIHTKILEGLADDYGQDWVWENQDEIDAEIEHIMDVLYNKLQKRI